jgi:hypothetical protein
MNLAVKFNLLKNTQPHYSYTPESCLENDNYKLYFDRTVLTDSHIKHNRPDIIILNKQQKQAYLLDISVPNSHNITQTYNTKINEYLELSVAMRNLWCLEKISILPLVISATGIVPQSLFKNLKILDLSNTLVVEIQKGIYYPSATRRHGNFAGVHTLLRILLSSNSAVLINIITGVSPPHFDFVVYYVLCQC